MPAKIVRELQDKEMAWKANGTRSNIRSWPEAQPGDDDGCAIRSPAVEADRPQAKPIVAIPLHKIKAAG